MQTDFAVVAGLSVEEGEAVVLDGAVAVFVDVNIGESVA